MKWDVAFVRPSGRLSGGMSIAKGVLVASHIRSYLVRRCYSLACLDYQGTTMQGADLACWGSSWKGKQSIRAIAGVADYTIPVV